MSCLDNIVTLTNKCGITPESLSGYNLAQAPEITPLNLADIANEKYIDGYTMARNVLDNAILDIKNDFLGVLAGNGIGLALANPIYTTSNFDITKSYPTSAKEKGFTLYKAPSARSRVKKLTIKNVSVLPLNSLADTNILIYDNGNVYEYPVDLTANLINTIEINHVVQGSYARVLLDNTSVSVASSTLTCFTGCGGRLPNDCGYTKGYNGDGEISAKEGFGLSADFTCECDYESILCDLSKVYIGKLIYTKARIGLLNERLYTNRATNWVIYGEDEARAIKSELEQEYVETWNTFVSSLPNVLKKYNDNECLPCKGIRVMTNI